MPVRHRVASTARVQRVLVRQVPELRMRPRLRMQRTMDYRPGPLWARRVHLDRPDREGRHQDRVAALVMVVPCGLSMPGGRL